MAKLVITLDTETSDLGFTIDGKAVDGEVACINIDRYLSYTNDYNTYWNVSLCHPSDDDSLKMKTMYSSAGGKSKTEDTNAAVLNYMEHRGRRR